MSVRLEVRMKKLIVLCLTLSFIVGPALTAYSQSSSMPSYYAGKEASSDWDMVVDVMLARPMGFIGMACGLGLGILALPFSVPSGSTGQVFQKLVGDPFDFTFVRPVGYYGPPPPPPPAEVGH